MVFNHLPVYDGTFTITSAEGTIIGDMSGFVEASGAGPEFPLHLVLTVEGGSGRFDDATGALAMEGVFGIGAATAHGTVDGTISVPPPTPMTKDDCKNGGWQDVADENGEPFANQGQCIAWVNHNT